jgi:hypothetical protein
MADLYAFFASSGRAAGVACAIAAGEKQAKANAVTRYERNRGFIRQGPQFLDFESVSRPAFDCEAPIITVWSLQHHRTRHWKTGGKGGQKNKRTKLQIF